MTENKSATGENPKTQAIKDVLANEPNAAPMRVVETLAKRGISVSRAHVATVQSVLEASNDSQERNESGDYTMTGQGRLKPKGGTIDTSDVTTTGDDNVKMSAVILKLAEPLLSECQNNEKRLQSAIAVTISVWNKLLLPDDKQSEFYKTLIDSLVAPNGRAEDIGTIVEITELISERRNRYFPDLRQLVDECLIEFALLIVR